VESAGGDGNGAGEAEEVVWEEVVGGWVEQFRAASGWEDAAAGVAVSV